MKQVLIVGEDSLSCALGERLVDSVMPGWSLATPTINTKGVTKLMARIPRYIKQARYVQPVVCVADTDGQCVKCMLAKCGLASPPDTFHLRLAVTEAESWVLADRNCFARHFGVSLNKIPPYVDNIQDPKSLLLTLVAKSSVKLYRNEMVSPQDPTRPGSGYNLHLCAFVRDAWSAQRARTASSSLKRSLARLDAFARTYE